MSATSLAWCPFCKNEFEENCEYLYIDLGHSQQVTPNHCDCGAYELGGWMLTEDMEYLHGWVRRKELKNQVTIEEVMNGT